MITKEQYEEAVKVRDSAQEIINKYGRERIEAFQERMKNNPVFTDDELVYSRDSLCPCGHGVAYPKDCGPGHYWDCSAILKGIQDKTVTHCAQMPFAFYSIKSEGETPGDTRTTRGVFKLQKPRKK